ncbi:MAG: pyk2, partial [Paenibacillus sp.]|nr:pyk2 [Paenibacillus sp.]
PVESVQTMSRIALRAESAIEYREIFIRQSTAQQVTITEAISQSVANSALDLDAKAIITPTESGYTARMVSKYRPKSPVIAVTRSEQVMRRLCLVWGVLPIKGEEARNTDEMFQLAVDDSIKAGHIRLGDLVIITAGVPVGRSGTTNLMKVHHVGEMIAKGQGIGSQPATGIVVVARTAQEALDKTVEGSILVTVATDKDYIPAFQKASAVITETGGITSHAAVVGLSLGVPVIVGVDNATSIMKDGMEVSVYAEVGVIYTGQAKVL